MDILAAIKQDHKQIETLVSNLWHSDDVQKIYAYFNQLSEKLEAYINIKEQVFYPVVRQNYPNGSELSATAEAKHRQIQQLLDDLENFSPTSDEFKQKTAELQQSIQSFFAQEEKNIIQPAEMYLDEIQRQKLGNEYKTAKS